MKAKRLCPSLAHYLEMFKKLKYTPKDFFQEATGHIEANHDVNGFCKKWKVESDYRGPNKVDQK